MPGIVHQYWNWKTAVLSMFLRSPIWIASELRASVRAALVAGVTDAGFRLVMAGLMGAAIQRLAIVRPPWLATTATVIGIPTAVHTFEALLHWSRGTSNWTTGLQVSILVSIVSTLFNLYSMRRGTLLAGQSGRPFTDDLRRLPRLFVHFVRHPFRAKDG